MSFQCPWPDVEISRTNDDPTEEGEGGGGGGREGAYSIRALLAETRDF